MPHGISVSLKVFLTSLLAVGILPGTAAPPTLDQVSWISGCWASELDEAGSGEQWMPLAGGTLLGVSRTVKDGKTVFYEFLQIKEISKGSFAYVVQGPRGKPVEFGLVTASDREMIFENTKHDFPQRIIYRLEGTDNLRARIEGKEKGELKGIDFPMRRIDCETGKGGGPK